MEKSGLLERVASIAVPAIQRFVAENCLKEANVGWTGSAFDRLFRHNVEEGVPESELVASQLKGASLDVPILTELGDKAEIPLAHMFHLLRQQAHREEGILLTNGYANIFYVRDRNGTLWAVSAFWFSVYRYWNVEAYSVGSPDRWSGGYQVFSRDS